MRIDAVELRRVALPLVSPFRTSWGSETARDVLLVRVLSDDGEGWGECVAMSEPLYSPEYVDGAHHVVRTHLVPRLLATDDVRAHEVADVLGAVQGHPMAKAALEMAVLDAELRADDVSLAAHLGVERTAVPAGVAVGLHDDLDELVTTVSSHAQAGYRRVKLKIAPGADLEPVRTVRDAFPDLLLQVDANGAYSLDDADHLAALDAFGLVLLEQPFAADRLLDHAELARRIETPVCLDESLTSDAVVADALALGAVEVVNVKQGRLGGVREALRVHERCMAADVPMWCGGMLETGIGRAVNVALAALPGFTLPGDLSASDRYWLEDLTPPFVLEDGCLPVPHGPGLGVPVLLDVVERCTTAVELLRR